MVCSRNIQNSELLLLKRVPENPAEVMRRATHKFRNGNLLNIKYCLVGNLSLSVGSRMFAGSVKSSKAP